MSNAQETAQTGQASERRPGKWFFEIAKDSDGWHWMLWSPNGRRMATNEITYDRKKDVLSAIKSFVDGSQEAKHILSAGEIDDDMQTLPPQESEPT